jgi:hypothetical protein
LNGARHSKIVASKADQGDIYLVIFFNRQGYKPTFVCWSRLQVVPLAPFKNLLC